MYFLEYIETSIAPFILIGLDIDFGNLDKLSLTFSNRFKLHDSVNTLKDMLETGYSAGRSLDTSKYIYGRTVAQATQVSKFMNDSLDVAKNAIVNAQNQSVRIDSAGIHVGGQDGRQLRMINNMIAMTDDNWQHAKLAIGLFGAEGARDSEGTTTNQYWGVNADVIGGKLLVGHNLIIENVNDMGVMQFKVDATGAFLNNGVLCIQTDTQDKGKLMIDPRYGIAAGNQDLYTIGEDGTSLLPSFINGTGVSLDADGMPENTMFYLDIRNGKAYFRGDIHAENGYFRGEVHATSGEFTGTLKAATLDGKLIGTKNGEVDLSAVDYIDLGGIVLDGRPGSTGITFRPGYEPVKYEFGTTAEEVNAGDGHTDMRANDKYRRDCIGGTWGSAYQFRGTDGKNGSDAKVPSYIKQTYIDSVEIRSPTIKANDYYIYPNDENDTTGSFNIFGMHDGEQYHMFQILYQGGDASPRIELFSPDGGYLHIGSAVSGMTYLHGHVSLENATITNWGGNHPHAVFA